MVPLIPFKKRIYMTVYVECIVVATSLIVAGLLVNRPADAFPIVRFVSNLSLSLKIDGLSMVFAGLVAALWPLATLYSFESVSYTHLNNRVTVPTSPVLRLFRRPVGTVT